MFSEGSAVERTYVDGVPVLWTDSDGPFLCGLMFRVGRLDESLTTSGTTHLVEHLALETDWPPEDFNATVEELVTHFWFTAEAERSLSMMQRTAAHLRALPVGRLAREREIMRTEASGRGLHQVPFHASLRFGATGAGLLYYPEYGLSRSTRANVRDWASRFFTKENAVIYTTARPPDDLRFNLPAGNRVAPPVQTPIPYVEYPSVYPYGPSETVGISYLVERSAAQSVTAAILEHRLRQWLRHRAGVTYHVEVVYMPLGKERALVIGWADALEHNVVTVRNAFIAVLDELAHAGASDEELEREHQSLLRAEADPAMLSGRLAYLGIQELLGFSLDFHEHMISDRAAVTGHDVSSAASSAFESLILVVPPETPQLAGRFRAYPTSSPFTVDGATFSPRKRDRDDPKQRLIIGDDGVMIEGRDRSTVRFADCVASLRWSDGSSGYWSADGFYVYVDPAEWKHKRRAQRLLRDGSVDPALVVELDRDPRPFEDEALLRALAAYDAENWEDATRAFEEGLAASPEEPMAWQMLAFAQWRRGNSQAALEAARRALQLDPVDVWTPRFLAHALRDTRQFAEAVEAAREAVRRAPADLETLATATDAFVQRGLGAEARPLADRAVELYPEDSRAWFCLGWCAQAGSDWEAAEAALAKAAKIEPHNAMWRNNLGWARLLRGKAASALKTVDKALELDPENEYAQRNRIRALALVGRRQDAVNLRREYLDARLERADAAIKKNPNDPTALSRNADALTDVHRYEEALAAGRAALEIEPTVDRARVVAELAGLLGDKEEEGRLLAEARSRFGDDPSLLSAQASLANLRGDTGAAQEAVDAMNRIGADEIRSLMARAHAAAAAGDWAHAERDFAAVVEKRPMYCCAHAWLGISLLEQGRAREASQKLEDADARVSTSCWTTEELQRRLEGS